MVLSEFHGAAPPSWCAAATMSSGGWINRRVFSPMAAADRRGTMVEKCVAGRGRHSELLQSLLSPNSDRSEFESESRLWSLREKQLGVAKTRVAKEKKIQIKLCTTKTLKTKKNMHNHEL